MTPSAATTTSRSQTRGVIVIIAASRSAPADIVTVQRISAGSNAPSRRRQGASITQQPAVVRGRRSRIASAARATGAPPRRAVLSRSAHVMRPVAAGSASTRAAGVSTRRIKGDRGRVPLWSCSCPATRGTALNTGPSRRAVRCCTSQTDCRLPAPRRREWCPYRFVPAPRRPHALGAAPGGLSPPALCKSTPTGNSLYSGVGFEVGFAGPGGCAIAAAGAARC